MRRLVLVIHGRVQGVFFRAETRAQAEKLGVVGFAVNQPDGAVRVVAEGNEDALQKFLAWCYNGPRFAKVNAVYSEWLDSTGEFSSFEIR